MTTQGDRGKRAGFSKRLSSKTTAAPRDKAGEALLANRLGREADCYLSYFKQISSWRMDSSIARIASTR